MGNTLRDSIEKTKYILLPFLVYYLAHGVVRLVLMFLLQFIADISVDACSFILQHNAVLSGIISMTDMLCGAVALIILMRKDIFELSVWDYVNLRGISFYRKDKITPSAVCWGIVILQSIAAAIGLNALLYVCGLTETSSQYTQTSDAQYSIPVIMGIVIYGIVSPFVEELLYRVVVYGRMKRRFPLAIALIVSSIFFGLSHGNLVQGIYGTVMGIVMCLACEYLHTVVGAFAVHSVANLSIYLLGVTGYLKQFGTVTFCIIFLGIALLLLVWQIVGSLLSYKKYGNPYGIGAVGIFWINDEYE